METITHQQQDQRRQRAIASEDKAARRAAIIDAAERLFAASPDHDFAMADVAREAGLAKGTVYLYFDSKELLLLCLHEQRVERFFASLIDRLGRPGPFDFDEVAEVIRQHLTEDPLYLPLFNEAMKMMQVRDVPAEVQALSGRISTRMQAAGDLLEHRLTGLEDGEGTRLLTQGYALVVGMWNLLGSACSRVRSAGVEPGRMNFADEVDLALRRFWISAVADARSSVESPA